MCGITGFLSTDNRRKKPEIFSLCSSMVDSLTHRGPDDSGIWVDEQIGLALGHRRLSVIDLSDYGHQPMFSSSGRYVIVLNGEIYNFEIIRKELEDYGYKFRGHSDTEVLLSAVEHWGFDNALLRFNGMFAFVLWDRKERILRLVRDRLGEKPLYYGLSGKDFIFASELKALRRYPSFYAEIDYQALMLYLRYAYIPAPYSIYKGIFKLLPGTVLTLKDFRSCVLPEPETYWSAIASAEKWQQNRINLAEADLIKELDYLLRDAVKIRMEADVPLGVFLSGGIDSSLVSALMQTQVSSPIKTFTIGFHERSYNEANNARRVADYLGTEHTELYVKPQDSLGAIPYLPDIYDEPFADSSQILAYLISKLSRNYVTVALSGDGGDEVFGGYNRYFLGRGIWNKIGRFPHQLRFMFAQLLSSLSPNSWDNICEAFSYVLPNQLRHLNWGQKIHKLARIIDAKDQKDFFSKLISFWQKPPMVVNTASESLAIVMNRDRWPDISHFSEWMMCMDLVTYLPDDIMVKVDRASMAVGLETRAVFLDHRVVEFVQAVPPEIKFNNRIGKLLLRRVLSGYLPEEFINVQKMGFALPLGSWLRGPLRPWAESLLEEKKIKQDGFFEPAPIRKRWSEHLSGKRDWQHHIWIILMFQIWKERWQKSEAG